VNDLLGTMNSKNEKNKKLIHYNPMAVKSSFSHQVFDKDIDKGISPNNGFQDD